MNLYMRLLIVFFSTLAASKLPLSGVGRTRFRVLPHDLDLFGHMNNGRYFQIMDIARFEWMLRTGTTSILRRNRWAPVLGGGVIRFRHALRIFDRYVVHSRLLGWDDRWIYLEHSFIDGKKRCAAVGVTRAALRDASGWVRPLFAARAVSPGARSPAIPQYIEDWINLDEQMYRLGAGPHGRPVETANASGVSQ